MTIKMVGTDLDGTLLRTDGTVSDRTRAAVAAADRAGLLVAFATGRPPRWLYDVANATGHTGIAVAANGAVIFDLATDTVIAEHILSVELLAEVTAVLRAKFPQIVFGIEYGDNPARASAPHLTFGAEPTYRHEWEVSPARDRSGRELPLPLIGDLETIISAPGVKLLVKNRDIGSDDYHDQIAELLGDQVSITYSSNVGLLEIGAAGITRRPDSPTSPSTTASTRARWPRSATCPTTCRYAAREPGSPMQLAARLPRACSS